MLTLPGKGILAASVDADAGISNRTVTWSSSDATIVLVGTDGTVTAVKAGTVTIKATSVADPTVSGAAAVTVQGTTTNNGAPVTVSISSINTTICGTGGCSSVPANLQNFGTASGGTGQLDVVLNVDAGGQVLQSITAILKCGNDSLVQTQTITSSSVASLGAEASSAPVTVSFNTAAFNSTTGVAALHNGTCTLSASAKTTTGTQSASPSQTITLNNTDFISTSISTTPSTGQNTVATGADGLAWRAGSVTVTALPVIYSTGRSIANAAISLVNGGTNPNNRGRNNSPLAAGGTVATAAVTAAPFTFTFPNSTTGATGVGGVTVDTLTAVVTTIDNNGTTGPAFAATKSISIRLDNLAPTTAGVVATLTTSTTSNGWVGPTFAFGSAISGLGATTGPGCTQTEANCDFGGVDKVTVTTQYAVGASTTFTTFTSPTSIPESSTGSAYALRVQLCDALGNCANSGTLANFGVDVTPPTVTAGSTTGPTNNSIVGIGQTLNTPTLAIVAIDPASAGGATGSGFSATPVQVTETRLQPSGSTGQTSTCVIGTASAASSGNTTCTAPAAQALSFNPVSTNPGQYSVTYFVVDQAGNASAPVTFQYYIDQNAPTVSGGLAIPGSIVTGTSFTTNAADNMDLASANGFLSYPISIAGNARTRIALGGTLSTTGVAFDNTLTRSATATTTLTQFFRNIGTVNGGVLIASAVKPDSVGVRALDAANNLSTPDEAGLPDANIATVAAPYLITRDLNDFSVAVSPTSVANGTGTGTRVTTITASVTAATATANTPFAQVCFYLVTPSGTEGGLGNTVTGTATNELSLLGCTTGAGTTVVAGNRTFQYTMSFDPDAKYGTAGTLNFVAIGVNGTGDALAAQTAAALTLVP